MAGCLILLLLTGFSPPPALAFEPLKGDMSGFDPNNPTFPTSGDNIKVGVFEPFSGPAKYVGDSYFALLAWVVHDINSQGGIKVDGKMKKIQIVKGDTQVKPATAKRTAEKLCLEEKVVMFSGTAGSHISLIAQQVAEKYKTPFMNYTALSDELMDAKNFNRYTFRTCGNTTQYAKALAYFYAARPERKFYLLCQDYAFGHVFAEVFKKYLAQYRPESKIVGEDFHPLFSKDFAPYLEKIKGAGAEVIISGNWGIDYENLLKQSRQMGMIIPIAGPFTDDPRPLEAVGGPNGAGVVVVQDYQPDDSIPNQAKLFSLWEPRYKTWKEPYNSVLYKWPGGSWNRDIVSHYWFFDVLQRAGSTDPEKIIKVWEGDTYAFFGEKLEMRACDHQIVLDMHTTQLEFPNKFYEKNAAIQKPFVVPARFCMPDIPEGLDRCKK